MIDEIRAITAAAEPQVAGAATLDALADVERSLVGKGSLLVALKKQLGGLDADERRTAGGALNQAQADLRALVDARRAELEAVAARERAERHRTPAMPRRCRPASSRSLPRAVLRPA